MRSITLMLLAVVALPAVAGAGDDQASLESRMAPFVHELELEEGRLAGRGGKLLVEGARRSHFLMVGEQHAAAGIAEVITALYRSVAPLGYRHAAIETGPEGARRLEALLRDDSKDALPEYFARGHNLLSIPFYFLREEAAFARAVVELSDAPSPVLWGVDQEFIAGGGIVLDRLDELAATEPQREIVARLRGQLDDNPMLLGAAASNTFDPLRQAFSDAESAEARRLVDDVVASNRIYSPFTGRGGSVYEANREREDLMKRNFMDFYWPVRQRDGEVPRVFLKFGANHLFRGLSPTHVLSLGTFVMDLAVAERVEAFNLHIDCLGGEVRNPRGGGAAPCESYFLDEGSAFRQVLPKHGLFVVDLRAMRTETELLERLDQRSRDLVWAFDAYVGVRDPAAASLFEGQLPDFGG